MLSVERPRIVVTLTNPERATDRATAELKNGRYLESVERAGGAAVPLDDASPRDDCTAALASMDGLVISGGPDIDPGRDRLDLDAFRAAQDRSVPVLGVCRGLQAINVFSGGSLLQHLDGHESAAYPTGPAEQHPIWIAEGSRLASIVGGAEALLVNTYHHQGVTADRLAAGLVASARAAHPASELVEALESRDPDRWLVGIQCHPERTESSPLVLERLWAAFVAAAIDRRGRTGAGRGWRPASAT
jgi:putative glutamine amidotransferase